MLDRVINDIKKLDLRDEYYREKINLILLNYKPEELNEYIEEYIDENPDMKKIICNVNGNKYYKYILYSSQNFDMVHIKWEKMAQSKIHDHPELGCIMMVLNDGKIIEDRFFRSDYANLLVRCEQKRAGYGDIGYIKSNKILHRIIAKEYTETLHIYLPGNYIPATYS
jgi:hypothetical protein